MLKVYGYSDDLVEIEGAKYPNDEIGCYDVPVYIRFTDETKIKINYENGGIWKIQVLIKGTAKQSLTECNDPEADIYSDIFEIEAEVKSVRKGTKK